MTSKLTAVRSALLQYVREAISLEEKAPAPFKMLDSYLECLRSTLNYVVFAASLYDFNALYNGSLMLKRVSGKIMRYATLVGQDQQPPPIVPLSLRVALCAEKQGCPQFEVLYRYTAALVIIQSQLKTTTGHKTDCPVILAQLSERIANRLIRISEQENFSRPDCPARSIQCRSHYPCSTVREAVEQVQRVDPNAAFEIISEEKFASEQGNEYRAWSARGRLLKLVATTSQSETTQLVHPTLSPPQNSQYTLEEMVHYFEELAEFYLKSPQCASFAEKMGETAQSYTFDAVTTFDDVYRVAKPFRSYLTSIHEALYKSMESDVIAAINDSKDLLVDYYGHDINYSIENNPLIPWAVTAALRVILDNGVGSVALQKSLQIAEPFKAQYDGFIDTARREYPTTEYGLEERAYKLLLFFALSGSEYDPTSPDEKKLKIVQSYTKLFPDGPRVFSGLLRRFYDAMTQPETLSNAISICIALSNVYGEFQRRMNLAAGDGIQYAAEFQKFFFAAMIVATEPANVLVFSVMFNVIDSNFNMEFDTIRTAIYSARQVLLSEEKRCALSLWRDFVSSH